MLKNEVVFYNILECFPFFFFLMARRGRQAGRKGPATGARHRRLGLVPHPLALGAGHAPAHAANARGPGWNVFLLCVGILVSELC